MKNWLTNALFLVFLFCGSCAFAGDNEVIATIAGDKITNKDIKPPKAPPIVRAQGEEEMYKKVMEYYNFEKLLFKRLRDNYISSASLDISSEVELYLEYLSHEHQKQKHKIEVLKDRLERSKDQKNLDTNQVAINEKRLDKIDKEIDKNAPSGNPEKDGAYDAVKNYFFYAWLYNKYKGLVHNLGGNYIPIEAYNNHIKDMLGKEEIVINSQHIKDQLLKKLSHLPNSPLEVKSRSSEFYYSTPYWKMKG